MKLGWITVAATAATLGAAALVAQDRGHEGHGMMGQTMPGMGQPAATAQTPDPHAGHGAGHGAAADLPPSVAAFIAANAAMHAGMDIEFTGNADIDFVRGMIPHHIGAIDMARVVLEYGTDPEIRKLAEAIVAAQDEEVAFMRAWLEKQPK